MYVLHLRFSEIFLFRVLTVVIYWSVSLAGEVRQIKIISKYNYAISRVIPDGINNTDSRADGPLCNYLPSKADDCTHT